LKEETKESELELSTKELTKANGRWSNQSLAGTPLPTVISLCFPQIVAGT
jgi:hypothetical protein